MNESSHLNEKYFTKALKNGSLVHVSEVENGLNCGCVCPCCETPVVAYNNPKNKIIQHFKHHSKRDCHYYFETMLHYLAKEVIQKKGGLYLPNVTYELSSYASEYSEIELSDYIAKGFNRSIYVEFDRVEVEKYKNGIKPDLIGYINNKELYIEIAVTHFIDEVKNIKIKSKNLSVIEIDLSSFDRNILENKLNEVLFGNTAIMKWINNPTIQKRKNQFLEKQKIIWNFITKNTKEYKVYGKNRRVYCPIINNKEDEINTDSCNKCTYLVEETERFTHRPEIDSERPFQPQSIICCIGHSRQEYEGLLKRLGANVTENKVFGK